MLQNNWSWRNHLSKCCLQGVIVILALGLLTTSALAHRVLIYAYAEGDTIYTESKFVPDTPVRDGKILVLDRKTEKVLLTGQTDDKGKFSFKIPAEAAAQKLDLEIVVEAAMGHRGEWLLKADKYLAGVTPGNAASSPPVSSKGQEASGGKAANIDQQALEALLNKSLERQLAPIKEMLIDLNVRRRTLPEIIGGLGYIAGIFGVVAYFMSKKQPKP